MFEPNQTSLSQLGYLLAEASKNVVFVVGAGLSKPAGIPLWPGLQDVLLQEAISYIEKSASLNSSQKDLKKRELHEITDMWMRGDLLEAAIPQEAYDRAIRNQLLHKLIPETYQQIWRFKPSGVISFNLDGIAEAALNGSVDQVATGLDYGIYEKFLLLSRPFLLQPHGNLRSKRSWVLGSTSRNRLLKDHHYRRFVNALLTTRRLVIVGFRPEDISFQTLLIDDFRTSITRGVPHFWICPSPTADARALAKLYNIEIIEYFPEDSAHSDIQKIFAHLNSYKPRDPHASAAYEGPHISLSDLPSDDELKKLPVEDIRRRLNAAIKGLEHQTSNHEDYIRFTKSLFRDFSLSLHIAWHIQENSQYEVVWGSKVEKKLGGGAFGGVWQAQDPVDGRSVAIKVLNQNVLHEPDFLEAFRRGVRAMRILSEAKVSGMVKYISAFDVPATVVMEYIDGVNFENAIAGSMLSSLADVLHVLSTVGSIVLKGHELDKHVLHRDLKPSNVMLKNIYSNDDPLEIYVLDFDLSWYEGALGKSMLAGTLNNYIAPEQLITRDPNASSRHTAVDVFGLGMLSFFGTTKTAPTLNIQNEEGFVEALVKKIRLAWSLPPGAARYIALTIQDATYSKQQNRCSMPTLIQRLQTIEAYLNDTKCEKDVFSLGIIEALLESGWDMHLDLNSLGNLRVKKTYVNITVKFDEIHPSNLIVNLQYSPTEEAPRGVATEKYIKPRIDRAEAILRKAGFGVEKYSYSAGATSLIAEFKKISRTQETCIAIGKAVLESAQSLQFG